MPARTDSVPDAELAAGLLLARRGQAFFSRALHGLRDEEFDAPSLLPGWTRRHVAVHTGANARALARLVHWAATGVETPMYSSPDARAEEIEFGATLPVRAIRALSDHAAIHLDVEWRDLPERSWSHEVRTAQGRRVPVRETVWMRTRELWLHTVDLACGARCDQFPAELLDGLLADLVRVWARTRAADPGPALVLAPTDRAEMHRVDPTGHDGIVVRGTAAQLVAWGTGRDRTGTVSAVAAPRWL